jgi:magnesium transporter
MAHFFDRLEADEIAQIRELRSRDRSEDFFWIDLDLAGGDHDSSRPAYTLEQVADALGIPERVPDRALDVLGEFDEGVSLAKKFHADDQHVVFPFFFVPQLDSLSGTAAAAAPPIEVHVLVHGQYLLTLSRQRLDLQRSVGEVSTKRRSEQYIVYVALEGMTITAFEALAQVEDAIEDVESQLLRSMSGGRRERSELLRGMRARLTTLRRRIGAERAIFERVAEEIDSVSGLEHGAVHDLFDRISGQLDRVVEGIDAASQSLSSLVELGINETSYRLTVVATIFLPLTFITGFFGMNFTWLVAHIDTFAAFALFGVGTLLISGLIAWYLILRREAISARADSN